MKRTPIKRGASLLKRGRLKQRGRKHAERMERNFGRHAERIRAMPCLVCGKTPSDPHHEPPVGRGGTARDLTPLCRKHHRQRHCLGSAAMFAHYYGIDLESEAKRIWGEAA